MQPEKLSERAARVAQEAKTFQQAINRFGPGYEKLWRNAVRRSAAEDVEHVSRMVTQEVEKRQREIDQSPILDSDKEVWVSVAHSPDRRTYFLSAYKTKRESAWYTSAKAYERGEICLPVQAFNDLIHELKTLILEGKLDEQIHLTAEQLIYSKCARKM